MSPLPSRTGHTQFDACRVSTRRKHFVAFAVNPPNLSVFFFFSAKMYNQPPPSPFGHFLHATPLFSSSFLFLLPGVQRARKPGQGVYDRGLPAGGQGDDGPRLSLSVLADLISASGNHAPALRHVFSAEIARVSADCLNPIVLGVLRWHRCTQSRMYIERWTVCGSCCLRRSALVFIAT